jgi:hypothetical protein
VLGNSHKCAETLSLLGPLEIYEAAKQDLLGHKENSDAAEASG